MLARILVSIIVLGAFLGASTTFARSVYTPRDSGTEAPGGPRAPEGIPTPSNFGRTQEGGLGYTDAYGNTISSEVPESKPHKRLPKGAYGKYGPRESDVDNRPLPDPQKNSAKPVWSFR